MTGEKSVITTEPSSASLKPSSKGYFLTGYRTIPEVPRVKKYGDLAASMQRCVKNFVVCSSLIFARFALGSLPIVVSLTVFEVCV